RREQTKPNRASEQSSPPPAHPRRFRRARMSDHCGNFRWGSCGLGHKTDRRTAQFDASSATADQTPNRERNANRSWRWSCFISPLLAVWRVDERCYSVISTAENRVSDVTDRREGHFFKPSLNCRIPEERGPATPAVPRVASSA